MEAATPSYLQPCAPTAESATGPPAAALAPIEAPVMHATLMDVEPADSLEGSFMTATPVVHAATAVEAQPETAPAADVAAAAAAAAVAGPKSGSTSAMSINELRMALGSRGIGYEPGDDSEALAALLEQAASTKRVDDEADDEVEDEAEAEADGDSDDDIYEVDRILEARVGASGTREYLIKWRGWGARFNSWEPQEHIVDEGLLAEFEARAAEKAAKEDNKRQQELKSYKTLMKVCAHAAAAQQLPV